MRFFLVNPSHPSFFLASLEGSAFCLLVWWQPGGREFLTVEHHPGASSPPTLPQLPPWGLPVKAPGDWPHPMALPPTVPSVGPSSLEHGRAYGQAHPVPSSSSSALSSPPSVLSTGRQSASAGAGGWQWGSGGLGTEVSANPSLSLERSRSRSRSGGDAALAEPATSDAMASRTPSWASNERPAASLVTGIFQALKREMALFGRPEPVGQGVVVVGRCLLPAMLCATRTVISPSFSLKQHMCTGDAVVCICSEFGYISDVPVWDVRDAYLNMTSLCGGIKITYSSW